MQIVAPEAVNPAETPVTPAPGTQGVVGGAEVLPATGALVQPAVVPPTTTAVQPVPVAPTVAPEVAPIVTPTVNPTAPAADIVAPSVVVPPAAVAAPVAQPADIVTPTPVVAPVQPTPATVLPTTVLVPVPCDGQWIEQDATCNAPCEGTGTKTAIFQVIVLTAFCEVA